MNRNALWVLLVLSIVGVVAALLYWDRREKPRVEYVVETEERVAPEHVDPTLRIPEWGGSAKGGTYSGTVVEAQGQAPIANAHVLLVATADDEKVTLIATDAEGGGPIEDIPVFGAFRIAADGLTDAKGVFRLSGGEARVVALFVYEPAHGPGMKAHLKSDPLVPGPNHQIRLEKAGFVVGRVQDRATHLPVPGADVSVFLQNPANQDERGTIPFTSTMSFARFQSFIAKELGARVWGVEPRGNDSALHLITDREGMFRLGPLMQEVQLEFVVSHKEYAWTDTDPEVALVRDNPSADPTAKILTRKRRTVVPPGVTVERTFELDKGKEISGTVTDEKGVAFEDVAASLEHVAQYSQHYFYRTHAREGKTDRAGRFRIAGLSYGPYVLRLTHPAFESKVFQPVPEGSDQKYVIPRGGWIDGTVSGGTDDRKDFVAEVRLSKVGAADGGVRRERLAVRGGRFSLEKVEPGRFDLSLASGRLVAAPVRVEVLPGVGATVELSLRAGGGFRLTVANSSGAPIDPVTAEVEFVPESGSPQRAGMVVSRGGVIEAEGLTTGRYRVSARAQGYVARATEPFEVSADRLVPIPTLVLMRAGLLRIASVKDENGRPPGEGVIRVFTVIQGDGTTVVAGALATGTISVVPGTVIVRVTLEDGRVLDTSVDVAEGATASVDVVLAPR